LDKLNFDSDWMFLTLVQNIPSMVYRCALDEYWTIQFMSDYIYELSGYPLSDFIENNVRSYASIIHPDDVNLVDRVVNEAVSKREPYTIEYRIIHANGEIRHVYEKGQGIFEKDASVAHLDGVITDITERVKLEESLAKREAYYRKMIETTHEGVWVMDKNHITTFVNKQMCNMLGYRSDEMIGHHVEKFIFPDDLDAHSIKMKHRHNGENDNYERRFICKDGSTLWTLVAATSMSDEDGNFNGSFAMFMDISERKQREEQIINMAFYDPLTQLANRRLLIDRVEQIQLSSQRNQHYAALLFLDLDFFKELNDSLGHDYGDMLLKQLAERMICPIRQGDTIARLGGDEFVIVLNDLSNDLNQAKEEVKSIVDKIFASLKNVFVLHEHEYYTSCSIGITLFQGDGLSFDEILKQADLAMYDAKNSGRNTYRFFSC